MHIYGERGERGEGGGRKKWVGARSRASKTTPQWWGCVLGIVPEYLTLAALLFTQQQEAYRTTAADGASPLPCGRHSLEGARGIQRLRHGHEHTHRHCGLCHLPTALLPYSLYPTAEHARHFWKSALN